MDSDDDRPGQTREAIIRLEAKIDVVLSRHEGKLDDLTRRQGETTSTLREHDSRVTANALTIAETRAQTAATAAEVTLLRNDTARDIADIKSAVEKAKPNIPAWAAVAVAALAVVLSPILTALMSH